MEVVNSPSSSIGHPLFNVLNSDVVCPAAIDKRVDTSEADLTCSPYGGIQIQ